MAIQGLTGLGPRLPEIGKLFKGAPKETRSKSGKEYQVFGRELDYWRFESKTPLTARLFAEAFAQDGGKPRHIPVFLPFATASENFQTCKEAYTAGGLEHRCDGHVCTLWLDHSTTRYRTDPVPCPTLTMSAEDAKYRGCKNVARLRVIIPALNQIGLVTVETHSINDILHLDACLPAYESLWDDGLRRIPFMLSRVEREISTPRDGKRVKIKKWLVELNIDSDWSVKYLSAQRQQSLAAVAAAEPLLLTAADDDEDDEASERAEIEAQFSSLWIGSRKAAADFDAYKRTTLAPLSLEQLRAKLTECQKKATSLKARAATASVAPASPATTGQVIEADFVEIEEEM